MLLNLDPVLNAAILAALYDMGHGDTVVVADANFPALRVAQAVLVDLPGTAAPRVLSSVRSLIPPDDGIALELMATADGSRSAVQDELIAAARLPGERVRDLDRDGFYEAAAEALLVIRTGEVRPYGNAILRKGVIVTKGKQS